MGSTESVIVRVVQSASTRDLRARVLRDHLPGVAAESPLDDDPATIHLGAFLGRRLVGVVTFFAERAPGWPGVPASRFRFMAVEPDARGYGVGRTLIEAVIDHARRGAHQLVWANARDRVLDFYRRLGFSVIGDGFDDPVSQLPHHLVVLELAGSGGDRRG